MPSGSAKSWWEESLWERIDAVTYVRKKDAQRQADKAPGRSLTYYLDLVNGAAKRAENERYDKPAELDQEIKLA